MLKVLIWQVSNYTNFQDNAIKILERQHDGIEIVGSAVNEEIAKVDRGGGYDVLLVVGAKDGVILKASKISSVVKYAIQNKLPEEKLLGDWIVSIPGFTLEKYRRLQRSRLSIFSNNCFGGLVTNMLGLQFRSPLGTNTVYDFIKFMREPHSYFQKQFIHVKGDVLANLKDNKDPFKIRSDIRIKLDDVSMRIRHYKTLEDFVEMWKRRRPRINWDNLFVEMCTENEDILRQFDTLPYNKKVCFVPFKSNLDSAWYINPGIDKKSKSISDIVIRFGRGVFFYYDLFDMLLYGKKTPLIDM